METGLPWQPEWNISNSFVSSCIDFIFGLILPWDNRHYCYGNKVTMATTVICHTHINSFVLCGKVHTCSGVDKKLVICMYITNIVINKCKQNSSLRSGMMQLQSCSHKLAGINWQFEAHQYSLETIWGSSIINKTQLAAHQLSTHKCQFKAMLGMLFWGRKNGSTLLQSNEDWFRSVSQVHNPFKHCRKSSYRLKFLP